MVHNHREYVESAERWNETFKITKGPTQLTWHNTRKYYA